MATRYDVAKLAGVSTATVSRVMNNMEVVSPELREKVMKAVDELNYKPNLTARGLKVQRSYNIAFLIPDITNPYYTEIYRGINFTASASGYTCSLIEVSLSGTYDNLLQERFDGIISAVSINDKLKEIIEIMNIPIVALSEGKLQWDYRKHVTVTHRIREVIEEAIHYIFNKGHRKIGLIASKAGGDSRLAAYKGALRKLEIEYNPDMVIQYEEQRYHYIAGFNALEELLEKNTGVTAVIAQNDLVTIGAIAAAAKRGYKIPGDISFLGCDDTVAAQFCIPSLTTIKLYKEKQGATAAKMLMDMIDGKTAEPCEFRAELIIRDSIK